MTPDLDRVLPAVVAALRRAAPPGVVVDARSRLDETGVDSLGMLEALVDLETSAGLMVSEEAVRRLSIELPPDDGLTVAEFTAALLREVTSGSE